MRVVAILMAALGTRSPPSLAGLQPSGLIWSINRSNGRVDRGPGGFRRAKVAYFDSIDSSLRLIYVNFKAMSWV